MGRKLLKLGIIVLFFVSFAWISRSILKIVATTAPDFKILWSFAKYFQEGKNLYLNPNVPIPNPYPPMTFLFYLPLTYLPYQYAQALFIFLIFASLVVTVLVSLKLILGHIPLWEFLITFSLVLFSFPAKYTLGMGQQNSLAFLFLLFSYYFWRKKIPIFSGIFLAFSFSFKPVLGFVLFFFIFQRAWKVLFFAFLSILAEVGLILLIGDLTFFGYWIKQSLFYLPLSGRDVYYNQGLTGFVSRLTGNIALIKNIVLISSLAFISTTFLTVKNKVDKNLSFSLFVISVPILDTLSWQHHFVWLIFPFVLLTTYAIRLKNAVILGLIGMAYLLVSWNFKNPSLYLSFPKILLLSNQFYGAVILWGINVYFLIKNNT